MEYNLHIDTFKIKELMAKKQIKNQTELAKILGISKNQLSNILSNKFNPIKSNVVELANFFDVNPLEIITKECKNAKN
jgi:DNA (cytosine-5)-methyltransferase 1